MGAQCERRPCMPWKRFRLSGGISVPTRACFWAYGFLVSGDLAQAYATIYASGEPEQGRDYRAAGPAVRASSIGWPGTWRAWQGLRARSW